jgi:hypothetical protein
MCWMIKSFLLLRTLYETHPKFFSLYAKQENTFCSVVPIELQKAYSSEADKYNGESPLIVK